MRWRAAGAIPPLLVLALGSACAKGPSGRFVWVDDYRPAALSDPTGVIRAGDVLDVRVLGQDQLSAKATVRSDGQVTLPFVGDLEVAGKTTVALGPLIEQRLRDYVNSPVVTVSREEAPSSPVSILGEVAHPGKFAYDPNLGMLDALALAGGLTEYAHKDRIFVLRGHPSPTRIRFDYRRLVRGEGAGLWFALQPGDVIVVE